jgi:hypothetical protein
MCASVSQFDVITLHHLEVNPFFSQLKADLARAEKLLSPLVAVTLFALRTPTFPAALGNSSPTLQRLILPLDVRSSQRVKSNSRYPRCVCIIFASLVVSGAHIHLSPVIWAINSIGRALKLKWSGFMVAAIKGF